MPTCRGHAPRDDPDDMVTDARRDLAAAVVPGPGADLGDRPSACSAPPPCSAAGQRSTCTAGLALRRSATRSPTGRTSAVETRPAEGTRSLGHRGQGVGGKARGRGAPPAMSARPATSHRAADELVAAHGEAAVSAFDYGYETQLARSPARLAGGTSGRPGARRRGRRGRADLARTAARAMGAPPLHCSRRYVLARHHGRRHGRSTRPRRPPVSTP